MTSHIEKINKITSNRTLKRLLDDEKLRGHLLEAVKHGRVLYNELSQTKTSKAPLRLASDAKLQKQLRAAVEELSQARQRTRTRSVKPLLLVAGGLLLLGMKISQEMGSGSSLTLNTSVSGKDAAADGGAKRTSSAAS